MHLSPSSTLFSVLTLASTARSCVTFQASLGNQGECQWQITLYDNSPQPVCNYETHTSGQSPRCITNWHSFEPLYLTCNDKKMVAYFDPTASAEGRQDGMVHYAGGSFGTHYHASHRGDGNGATWDADVWGC